MLHPCPPLPHQLTPCACPLVQFIVPAALVLASSQPVSKASPDLSVRLTTLMGEPTEGFAVKVKSLETPAGEVVPRTRAMTAAADK